MKYKVLHKQVFSVGNFAIVPIRFEDRIAIMKWRNEQIYHLRQQKPLTIEDQDHYFNNVVSKLFDQEQPNQILFSFLENDLCIGYGGLVHINWVDKNAEISFIMNTALESLRFHEIWCAYLGLINQVAFQDLNLHKLYTYAFDLRPHLYKALESSGFQKEAVLKDHCFFENKFKNVVIHAQYKNKMVLRRAISSDVNITFEWASNAVVRQYALTKNKIEFDSHTVWFNTKINDSKVYYYIAMIDGQPIGSIRFDQVAEEAVISYLIDPKFHGKGFGKKIVEEGIAHFRLDSQAYSIVGIVENENKASLKIFRDLFFKEEFLNENTLKFKL
ncbi:GNAT family N-acetyltransferase [Flavobacterium buctense]|uniref:GNAT family N-acetyltransferase n=1 Tax=Flavobacterium buctense TaxID=1648146 RepID=A0ABU9E1E6_9FLAO|nr:GNAT family N-acetyltransferase [Flavobacterium buctense]